MTEKTNYTQSQKNVINYRGKNMLVSASAGTGKTTVMIERIAALLSEGADVSEIVVVTFTNLAAAEMKSRLAVKLTEKARDRRIIDQLERLDGANISTLHSFCSELLRNYFYVADIDPSFTVLDGNDAAVLRENALSEVMIKYYIEQDDDFKRVYKIFTKSRREESFREVIFSVYNFSRCIENFGEWYCARRKNLTDFGEDNPFVKTLLADIRQSVAYYAECMQSLFERSKTEGLNFADVFAVNAERLRNINATSLQNALFDLCKLSLEKLPNRNVKTDFGADKAIEESIRTNYRELKDDVERYVKKYSELCRGESVENLWKETEQTARYLDKIVEITERFDAKYYELRKERGGLDFNDLEHLTLKLFNDDKTAKEIREKYKYVFVDEYQDTNPVQEAIIGALSKDGNLFMVGDVKQSIYGFRGCEPQIFVDKYARFKKGKCGRAEELNDNFRSNREILNFVNEVFSLLMTEDFGKVNYRRDAQLIGTAEPVLKTVSTKIDLAVVRQNEKREIDGLYDITAECLNGKTSQGALIAKRIREYVGTDYVDKNGLPKTIGYGDIVILMRSLTDKALEIYNALVTANIPVAASFKSEGYSSQEIKDVINLLRVIGNPYNDIYFVGVCLSPFGRFTESELGEIRLDTEGRIPFYSRIKKYRETGTNAVILQKIDSLMILLEHLRFYSYSASVCEVILEAIKSAETVPAKTETEYNGTDYLLYVQGLPNSGLRMRKLYAFIDGLKGAAYASCVDKFLAYLDESDEKSEEEGMGQTNAVRIMTMHASKGLEFPVVIVAGLETQFLFDNPAIMQNAELGLAMNYYDFNSRRVAKTVSYAACGAFNKTKQREEEMRLLYVALTRAKLALNLVGVVDEKQLGAIPKLPQKARSFMDWILYALKNKYRTADDVTADALEVNVFRDITDSAEQADESDLICEQESDERSVYESLNYEYRFGSQVNMPTKVVSSALDKEYIDATDQTEFTLRQNNSRTSIGTAYHKTLQYVDLDASREAIKETILSLINDGRIDECYSEQLDVELIYAALNNAALKNLIAQGTVYREKPFMLSVPFDEVSADKRFSDETILQGVIDLLIIGEGVAYVIDYKYTSRSDTAQDNYQAQLNSYKLAVRKICGIENVECYIMSIADGKLIKM